LDKKANIGTRKNYESTIANWRNFCLEKYGKADIISDLIEDHTEEDHLTVLQEWIIFNKDLNANTVINSFSRLKMYLHYRGIKLNPIDIKQGLDFRRGMQEEKFPLTAENIQKITDKMKDSTRIQFICQSSGLLRIGELVQIRRKHLIISKENIIVKLPATITKFNKARTTFFSKEASAMLLASDHFKNLNENDLVFGTSDNPTHTQFQNTTNSESNSEQALVRILQRSDINLNEKYESSGRRKVNTHSFRAFGITKLSRVDPNFAKMLAGQKGYLITEYDRIDDKSKLELYQKYEIELTIDQHRKKDMEIETLKEEKAEWEEERKAELEKMARKLRSQVLKDIESGDLGKKFAEQLKSQSMKVWGK